MEKPVILLVEDETDVMLANQEYLEGRGMRVVTADTLAQARECLQNEAVDLVLLDINLPDGSGLGFVEQTQALSCIPVIFLTCRTDKEDVLYGLGHGGGCDYITKPYDLDVLYARIMAQLRREGALLQPRFSVGDVRVEVTRYCAYVNGEDALLKPKEFSLLLFLLQHPGRVLSDAELYRGVWGRDAVGDTRTVRVHIHALRKKLCMETGKVPWIETFPQEGYCLRLK